MRRRLLAFFALVHSLAPANPASGAKPISDPSCREAFVAASQLNAAFWSTCVAMADQAILDGTYFDAFCKDGILYCCNESYCVEMASGRVQLELESLPLGGIDVEPVVVPIVQSAPTRPSDAFLTFQSLAGEPSAPAPGGDPAALREVVA